MRLIEGDHERFRLRDHAKRVGVDRAARQKKTVVIFRFHLAQDFVHMDRFSVLYPDANGIQSRAGRDQWVQTHEYRDDSALSAGLRERVNRSNGPYRVVREKRRTVTVRRRSIRPGKRRT